MIEVKKDTLSIKEQCSLLDISRSGYYYKPVPMSDFNIELMKKVDEVYTESPEYGSRKIRDVIRRENKDSRGFHRINRKRIQRLMRIMGIEAIYPKKNLSKLGKGSEHKIYPYLLRHLAINRPNQVWSTDITYIRLEHGFVYLVAIMDWYSRRILSWEVSITMDTDFCISALESAIRKYGTPEIFNSDQGSQFTSKSFREVLENRNVKISMDGKGRALDNIVIERFWRTIKYADIYTKDYGSAIDVSEGISKYIEKYNMRRPHESLEKRTPDEVYRTAS